MPINDADINICTAALHLVGAEGITAFSDETREASLSSTLYPMVKQNTLQKHSWRFAIRQEQLALINGAPLFGFTKAYQLPADFLRFVGKDNPTIKHQIFENKVYTDLETLYASILYDIDAQYFPSYFKYLLTLEMAKAYAFGLLEDESKADKLEALARNQLILSKSVDSQNNTTSVLPEQMFSLTNVRYG